MFVLLAFSNLFKMHRRLHFRANKKYRGGHNMVEKSINNRVVILTSDKSNIENLDIKKFNKEYPILKVAKTNKFHDRFII